MGLQSKNGDTATLFVNVCTQGSFKESYMAAFYEHFNEDKYTAAVKDVSNSSWMYNSQLSNFVLNFYLLWSPKGNQVKELSTEACKIFCKYDFVICQK